MWTNEYFVDCFVLSYVCVKIIKGGSIYVLEMCIFFISCYEFECGLLIILIKNKVSGK